MSIPPELPPIMGDRMALTSAVDNLLDNAVKYSPPGAPGPVRSGSRRPRVDDPCPRSRLRHRRRRPGSCIREILPRQWRNLASGQRRGRGIEPGAADRGSPRRHSRLRQPCGRGHRFPHSVEDRMKSILVVEDEPAIATGLRDDLELDGYQRGCRGGWRRRHGCHRRESVRPGLAGCHAAEKGRFQRVPGIARVRRADARSFC